MSLSPLLKDLEARQQSYEASDATKAKLSGKILTTLIAPTAVGKSTLAKKVVELGENKFSESYSVVTRPRRPDDPKGYRTRDEGYTVDHVATMIEHRELTHYVIHPSGNIYGSLPESFPARYNLLPCVPSIIEVVRRAGFAKVHTVYIVTSVDQWAERLTERRQVLDYPSRLLEAIESVTWAINHADDVIFIENISHQLDHAARLIMDVSEGRAPTPQTARGIALARDMLLFAQTELKHFK